MAYLIDLQNVTENKWKEFTGIYERYCIRQTKVSKNTMSIRKAYMK
jgi:hypothetical protein